MSEVPQTCMTLTVFLVYSWLIFGSNLGMCQNSGLQKWWFPFGSAFDSPFNQALIRVPSKKRHLQRKGGPVTGGEAKAFGAQISVVRWYVTGCLGRVDGLPSGSKSRVLWVPPSISTPSYDMCQPIGTWTQHGGFPSVTTQTPDHLLPLFFAKAAGWHLLRLPGPQGRSGSQHSWLVPSLCCLELWALGGLCGLLWPFWRLVAFCPFYL